jgi:hypothetical protein
MSTAEVWAAVQQLAAEWSKSPLVQRLAAALPPNDPPAGDLTTALQNMDAGLSGVVSADPLLTTMWEQLADQLPLVTVTPEVRRVVRSLVPIGHAVEWSVGWLRSRIPGYPLIPTPQLAARGLRRCEEYGDRLPWRRQMIQAGLQYQPSPSGVVARHLRLSSTAEIDTATVRLAGALSGAPEWQDFARLSSHLEHGDRVALRAARKQLTPLLTADAVDAFEPETMHRRQQFRRERTDEAIEALAGRPREFADAFARLDDLIDLVAINILGQLACFGTPMLVDTVEIVELTPDRIRFIDHTDSFPHLGALIRLSDPLARDVIRIDSIAMSSDQISQMVMSVGGQRLSETAEAFAA